MSVENKQPLLHLENLNKWFPRKRTVKDAIQKKELQYVKAVSDVTRQKGVYPNDALH